MTESEYENCGIIYVATGERFVKEAQISAQSINEVCQNIPLTLFTDRDISLPEFDSIYKISNPNYGFADKIENMLRSPYERTIYLDCDTYLNHPEGIHHIFEVLEEFDVAAAHDTVRTTSAAPPLEEAYDEGIPDAFPMFQGGVLAYKSNDEVTAVLENWLDKYRNHLTVDETATDQEALRAALYESNLRIATLPPEYNFRIPYPQVVEGKIRLLHGRASNFDDIATKINNSSKIKKSRVYIPVYLAAKGLTNEGEYERVEPLINPGQSELKIQKLWLSIKEEGVLRTGLHIIIGGVVAGRTRHKMISDSIEEVGYLKTVSKIIRWYRTGEYDNQ